MELKKNKVAFSVRFTTALSCLLSLFTIVYCFTFFATRAKFTLTVLPIALVIILLNLNYKEGNQKPGLLKSIMLWTITIVILWSALYFWIEFYTLIVYRVGVYNITDFIFASITILLVLYLVFKTMGTLFGIVITSPFLLVAFGSYLPYPFTVSKLALKTFIAAISLDIGGIWGSLTQAMATFVGIFVLFAAIVRGFGGLESLVAFFIKLLGKNQVLFPQVATLSSMLFGSFSGSAIANVAGTGAFTIPMMKSKGMKPEDAAAVETIASTGGIIIPPIMGAGAFIMAEMLGVSYVKIIAAGVLPALVFYLITFLNTHWVRLRQLRKEMEIALKLNNSSSDHKTEEDLKKLYKSYYDPLLLLCIFGSIVFLIYLLITGRSILAAGVRTVVSFYIFVSLRTFLPFLFSYIKPSRNSHNSDTSLIDLKQKGKEFVKKFIISLDEGGRSLSEIILLGAGLGIISSTLLRTGLLYRLGVVLVDLARGDVFLLLVVTILVSLLLGMAVSALATYLLVAPIVVTAFRTLGVEPITAHFIVFYGATLAPITPPIAPACAIAAKLAQAKFIEAAKASILLGQGLILMPLVFITFPSILQLDYLVFLIILSSMIYISIGCFVEIHFGKKFISLGLIALGLAIMFNVFPFYINLVFSVLAILLLIISLKNNGTLQSPFMRGKHEMTLN